MTRLVTAGLIALAFLAAGAWLSVGSARAEDPIADSPTGTVEPIIEPAIDPIAPISEPVVEPIIETAPVTDTIAHVIQPVVYPIGPISEPVVEPIIGTAPVTDTIAHVTQPVVETSTPITEPIVETVAPTTEPVVEAVGLITEPVVEPVTPVIEPVTQVIGPSVETVLPVAAPAVENMVQESTGVPFRNSAAILSAHSTVPPASPESAPAVAESGPLPASARAGHPLIQPLRSEVSGSFSPRSSPQTATAALFGALRIQFAGATFRRLSTSVAVFSSIAYAPLTPPA